VVKQAHPAHSAHKSPSTGVYREDQNGFIKLWAMLISKSCKRKHMLHSSKPFLLMWNGLKIETTLLFTLLLSCFSPIFFSREACKGTIICEPKLWLIPPGQLMGPTSPCQRMRHHCVPAAMVQEHLVPAWLFSGSIHLSAPLFYVWSTGAQRSKATPLMLCSGS